MSTSLYDTFGNTTSYEMVNGTLVAYLESATIKFPLPEASSELLATLTNTNKTYNPAIVAMVESKLQKAGFKKPTAKAMSGVLMAVSDASNVDPLEYFDVNENSLNLTVDAYNAMNSLRPAGSRVGIAIQNSNSNTRVAGLIQP
mgnify:CR=1 FL=1|jgi:hypothetical protein|tara:strand:- start:246 stop:677 length:432 start_codon:yes stop_codon:yes gene_type:complete